MEMLQKVRPAARQCLRHELSQSSSTLQVLEAAHLCRNALFSALPLKMSVRAGRPMGAAWPADLSQPESFAGRVCLS